MTTMSSRSSPPGPLDLSSRTENSPAQMGSPVPGLKLPAAKAPPEKKTVAGRVLGMLTPRAGLTPRTPREPEEREMTVCMVCEGKAADRLDEEGKLVEEEVEAAADPLGVQMEGATVAKLAPASLAARWSAAFEYGLREGDIILTVNGARFESGKPLAEYLVAGQRAYRVGVRRTVVPPRSDLSARISRGFASIHAGTPSSVPATQEAMERALMEWEYFRPKDAHPDKGDESDDDE